MLLLSYGLFAGANNFIFRRNFEDKNKITEILKGDHFPACDDFKPVKLN